MADVKQRAIFVHGEDRSNISKRKKRHCSHTTPAPVLHIVTEKLETIINLEKCLLHICLTLVLPPAMFEPMCIVTETKFLLI